MPGQEKMVMEYYQKNQNAVASLRGALYEEKVIELIKTKIKLEKKTIKTKEAEDILKKISEDSKTSKSSDTKKQQKKTKITKKKQKKLAKTL